MEQTGKDRYGNYGGNGKKVRGGPSQEAVLETYVYCEEKESGLGTVLLDTALTK